MNKADFMGALSLYLSMSGNTGSFALEVYTAALHLDFDRLPTQDHLVYLVKDFYLWAQKGMKTDRQPLWIYFKEPT